MELQTKLAQIAKKWVFQEEKGLGTGYLHYQIRLKLNKRMREPQVKSTIFESGIKDFHLSPTSKEVHKTSDFNYVMKPTTRINGPWSDQTFKKDKEEKRKKENMPLKTKKLIERGLSPWMKQVLQWREDQLQEETHDDRSIIWIYDPVGEMHSKSSFAEYCDYYNLSLNISKSKDVDKMEIFSINEAEEKQKDENQIIMMIIDVERANDRKSDEALYEYLEKSKNGIFSTWKYNSRKIKQSFYPLILVFSNHLPNKEKMTGGRFDIFTFDPNDELVPYDETTIEAYRHYWEVQLAQRHLLTKTIKYQRMKRKLDDIYLPHLKN